MSGLAPGDPTDPSTARDEMSAPTDRHSPSGRPGPADAGAFVERFHLPGAATGPLAGVTVAVKDLFDVAGYVTGAGNPDFAAHRSPATAHAAAVAALLDAGATVVGKAITDELAYSLSGTNVHYGTPINTAAPDRVPGGSSSGSAAAVAAGDADLGLGTDTGGSIRVPASYCGLFGWRPTHGAVSVDGVVPLSPRFDTVGLLARDADLLATAAATLLPPATTPWVPLRAVAVAEAWAEVDVAIDLPSVTLGWDLYRSVAAFRTLQAAQAWATHGPWINESWPRFGPDIAARFQVASEVSVDDVAAAEPVAAAMAASVRTATAGGTVLVVPAAAGPAPLRSGRADADEARRAATLRLTAPAGLAGAPVVVLPAGLIDGAPFGVAAIGAPGGDRALLDWALLDWAAGNRVFTTGPLPGNTPSLP